MSEFFISEREEVQARTDLAFGRAGQRQPRRDIFGVDVFSAPAYGAARASWQVSDYVLGAEERTFDYFGLDTEGIRRGRARLRSRIRQSEPNPLTDSYSAQVLNQVSNVLTLAAAGYVTGGQATAAAGTSLVLGEEGRIRLIDAGVDPDTAAWGGALEGTIMGLGVIAPAALPLRSILLRSASGAGINASFGVGFRGGMNAYLNARGYPEVAENYQWFDPAAMTLDVILGAAFGAVAPGPSPRARPGQAAEAPAGRGPASPLVEGETETAAIHAFDQAEQKLTEGNLEEAYAAAVVAQRLGHSEADALLARIEEEGGPLVAERGRARADEATTAADPTPIQKAAALHHANVMHRDVKSAPGIPATRQAQRAHRAALREAAKQAEMDEPIAVQSMFAEALALRRPAQDPMTLTQFVRRQGEVRNDKGRVVVRGGIKDDRGDIAGSASDNLRGFASLLSPTGRPLDDVALAAWEAGYFPGSSERPSINELIDALDAESRGQPHYSAHDEAEMTRMETREAFEREFGERGIDINAPDEVLLEQIRAVYGEGDFVPWPVKGETEVEAIGDIIREEGGEEAFAEWQQSLEDAERYGVPLNRGDIELSMGTGKSPRGTFRAAMILHAEQANPEDAAAMLGVDVVRYRQSIKDSRFRARRLREQGLSDEAIAARFGVDTDVVTALFDESLKYRNASTDRFLELYNAKDQNGRRLYSAEQIAEMTGLKDERSVRNMAAHLRKRGLTVEKHGTAERYDGDVESGLARAVTESYLATRDYTATAERVSKQRGVAMDRRAAKRRVDAFLAAVRDGTQEPIVSERQRASLAWTVSNLFHDGLSGAEIATALIEQFPDADNAAVASALSQRRRQASAAVRGGYVDMQAARWGVRPEVVETLADPANLHRRRASALMTAVVRLSQRQPDGSLLSGSVIAERLRGMGFEKANRSTVMVYQTRARDTGFAIPFRRADAERPPPARAYEKSMIAVRDTLVGINSTSREAARILADQRRMGQPAAVRWMVDPNGVTYAWDGGSVWHADIALALGRPLEDFDRGVAHNVEELREFDRARLDRRPLASRGVRGLFSVLERTVEQSTTEVAPGSQWAATLRQAAGIKKEELSWTGVLDWLEMQRTPVKRQEIMHFLEEHGVRVMETLKGSDSQMTPDMQAEYLHLIEEKDTLEAQRTQLMERDQDVVDRGGARRWLPMDSIARQLGFDGWGGLTDPQRAEVEAAFYNQPGREEHNALEERLTQIARDLVRFEQLNDVSRAESTRWGHFTLEGGENYRELLLTMPARLPELELRFEYGDPELVKTRSADGRLWWESNQNYPVEGVTTTEVREGGMTLGVIRHWPYTFENGARAAAAWEVEAGNMFGDRFTSLAAAKAEIERRTFRLMLRDEMAKQEFRHMHWAESNVLAHVRVKDRVDRDGRRVLFLEEIQSDWMQRGRKVGFRGGPSNEAELRTRKVEVNRLREEMARDRDPVTNVMRDEPGWHKLTNELRDIDADLGKIAMRVADAPFRRGWPLLALKRVVRWAAEGGYDAIAWAPGEVHNTRFPNPDRSPEAMRTFYDEIVVNHANGLGKKHGARVGQTRVRTGEPRFMDMRVAHDGQRYWVEGRDRGVDIVTRASEYFDDVIPAMDRREQLRQSDDELAHVLPITPELRSAALDGLPLFSAKRAALAGSSKAELEATLAREFGSDWRRLADAGRVEILHNALDLDFGASLPFSLLALHSKSEGKVYLFADNISAGEARGVVLHEIGVHYGMREFLGARRFAQLHREMQALVDAGHPEALRARELAREHALDPSQIRHETVAYLVEMAPELPLVRRILAAIRQWLWRTFGPEFGMQLTPDDIRVMAAASLRRAARQAERASRPLLHDSEVFASGGAGFHSPLLRAIEQSPTARAPAAQWSATLARTPGVKKAEIDWLGVNEWLAMQEGPVSREALAAFVRENGVQLDEVVLREAADVAPEIAAAKSEVLRVKSEELIRIQSELDAVLKEIASTPGFRRFPDILEEAQTRAVELGGDFFADSQGKLTKDGGEALFALFESEYMSQPLAQKLDALQNKERLQRDEIAAIRDRSVLPKGEAEYANETLAGGEHYREILVTMPNAPREYTHSHFDHDNIVGWVRVNDRRDTDGRRILFVEELQSDWGQSGRRRGFAPRRVENLRVEEVDKPPGVASGLDETRMYHIVVDLDGETVPVDRAYTFDRAQQEERMQHPATQRALWRMVNDKGVPAMPFPTSWPTLMMRRVIREAVEGGYDAVAWTSGAAQADRYRLDVRGVRSIKWHAEGEEAMFFDTPRGRKAIDDRDLAADELQAALGADVAARLQAIEPDKHGMRRLIFDAPTDFLHQGMRKFYDEMIPNIARDLGRKHGANLEEAYIDVPEKTAKFARNAKPAHIETVRLLPITEAMRDSVTRDGVPMFAAGDKARGRGAGRSTVESVEAEVQGMFGDRTVLDAGFVRVVDSPREVPVKHGVPPHVGALYDSDTRAVYLIAPRIRPGNVRKFVFHELGVHFGLRDMMGRRAFTALLRRVEQAATRGDTIAAAAMRDARKWAGNADHIPEETLSYWVERTLDAPGNTRSRSLLEEMFAAVRAWMVKTFPEMVNLTDADVRELVLSSLRRAREQARRQIIREQGAKQDLPLPSPARDALADDPNMQIASDQGRLEPAGRALNRAELGERKAVEEMRGIEAAAACAARHGIDTAAPVSFITARVAAGAGEAVGTGQLYGLTAGIPVGWAASHVAARNADPYGYLTAQAAFHSRASAYAQDRASELSWVLGTNDERFPLVESGEIEGAPEELDWPPLWDYPEPMAPGDNPGGLEPPSASEVQQ